MRAILIAVVALAGCPDSDDAIDAIHPTACEPPVVEIPVLRGDGTLPIGDFAIAWSCLEGCDGVPPVMALADRITIEPESTRIAAIEWTSEAGAIDTVTAGVDGGCWVVSARSDQCHPGFAVCGRNGRPFVTRLAWRVVFGDAASPVQVWEMH